MENGFNDFEDRITVELDPQTSREVYRILARKSALGGFKESAEITEEQAKRYKKTLKNLKEKLQEQWTIPMDVATHELVGHLRDWCQVTTVLQGGLGETVNIPYVKDFSFDEVTVGGTLTEKTGLVGSTTATITEYGAYTQIPYDDIEEYGEQILPAIERFMRKAALRAEDIKILKTVNADTEILEIDKHTETSNFASSWIPEIIAKVMEKGKDVDRGDVVLALSPAMHKDLASKEHLSAIYSDSIIRGLIKELYGVSIVVVDQVPTKTVDTVDYKVAIAFRKNSVLFAPKRDLLVEMQRDTVNRKVKIVGTHTFAVTTIDSNAIVRVVTPETA